MPNTSTSVPGAGTGSGCTRTIASRTGANDFASIELILSDIAIWSELIPVNSCGTAGRAGFLLEPSIGRSVTLSLVWLATLPSTGLFNPG